MSRKCGASSVALLGGEAGPVQRPAVAEGGVRRAQGVELIAERPIELRLPLDLSEALLDRFQVGERQLQLDDAQVLDGVGGAGDVVVDERPQDDDDGVDLPDVGEEAVAQALTLAGALDEPADVDHLDGGMHDVAALRHLGESVEALVGDLGDADVGILGGERVRRRQRSAAGEGVVQRALTRVGQADEAEAFHEAVEATCSEAPFWAASGSLVDNRTPTSSQRPNNAASVYGDGMTPLEALDRAIHYLDRAHETGFKAKAFVRASEVVRELPDGELEQRAAAGTLTELPGIGNATARLVTEALTAATASRPTWPSWRRRRWSRSPPRGSATATPCVATATPTRRGAMGERRSRRWPGRRSPSATSTSCSPTTRRA